MVILVGPPCMVEEQGLWYVTPYCKRVGDLEVSHLTASILLQANNVQ